MYPIFNAAKTGAGISLNIVDTSHEAKCPDTIIIITTKIARLRRKLEICDEWPPGSSK